MFKLPPRPRVSITLCDKCGKDPVVKQFASSPVRVVRYCRGAPKRAPLTPSSLSGRDRESAYVGYDSNQPGPVEKKLRDAALFDAFNSKIGSMNKPVVGKRAPAFSLPTTAGGEFSLKDTVGQKLVLYFYPKDNTPGCTQEGADFASLAKSFAKARTTIVGISGDSLDSHQKFKAKMKFPFELLADEDRSVCQLYDVIREKNLYGRKFMGIERSTFLIDAKGLLSREWRKVRVKGHAEEVLTAAAQL